MIKVYGSDLSSPANKVRMVANYIGLKYEYVKVDLRKGEQRQEGFLKMNPVGKIPVLDDNGFYLFESGAICRYLAVSNKSDLYPADVKKQAIIDQWIDFVTIHISGGMSKILFNKVFYKFRNVEVDLRSLADGIDFLKQYLPIVDKQLGNNKFLTGSSISLADISLLAALDPAEIGEVNLAEYPNVNKWRTALKKEKFYQDCHKEYGEVLKQPAK